MAFIETADQTRIFYRDWGKGGEPSETLVFVASQALSADIWNYNLPFFTARGMRCIAYDRRGHGRSDVPSNGYHLDMLVRDLDALFAQLELRDVTLIGHSLGGAEIIRWLAQRAQPGQALRAVLISPTAPRMSRAADYPQGIELAELDALAAAWTKDFSRWVAENKRPFFAPETSEGLVEWGARLIEAIPLYVLLEIWKTTTSLDLREDLRSITVPTLVLHGALDQSVPVAFGEHAARLIRNAIFKCYPDAAHGIFITHAEQVHHDILEFLATTQKKDAR